MSSNYISAYCQDRGKPVDFQPTGEKNLFTADFGLYCHRFDYRDEERVVVVPYKGETEKKFWAKLLRYIREDKRYVDQLWEEGLPV